MYTYTGTSFSLKDKVKRFWKFIFISSILMVIERQASIYYWNLQLTINFCTITVATILSTRGYGNNGDELINYISTLLIIELGAVLGLFGYSRQSLALVGCYLIVDFSVMKDVIHFIGTDVHLSDHKS